MIFAWVVIILVVVYSVVVKRKAKTLRDVMKPEERIQNKLIEGKIRMILALMLLVVLLGLLVGFISAQGWGWSDNRTHMALFWVVGCYS